MKTLIKSVATLAAVLSINMFAAAEGQQGNREGQKKGQKGDHECKKGGQDGEKRSREDVIARFDKDGDGKLSKKERTHAKKARKRHHNGENNESEA